MLNPIVMIGWVAYVNRAPVMGISASQAVAPSGNVALIYSKAGGWWRRERRDGGDAGHLLLMDDFADQD